MKPTIRDVAKHAGVSVATVSRYLNKSSLIADASAEKVKRAIDELDYKPSMIARGLLHGSTRTIALAVDYDNVETYGNDFFLRIQFGLEQELASKGYYLMIAHVGTGKDTAKSLDNIVKEDRIDGLVLLSELARPEVLDLLDDYSLPYVVTGRVDREHAVWVDIDNCKAGYYATKRLLDMGAADIAFMTNSFEKVFVSERFSGCKKAMEEAGLSFESKNVIDGLLCIDDVNNYVLTNRDRLCEAYVVSDSIIAFSLMRALEKTGVIVPDQVQVIAFDNNTFAEVLDMTVVDIDVTALGKAAGKALLQQLRQEHGTATQLLLSVDIIERGSVNKRKQKNSDAI